MIDDREPFDLPPEREISPQLRARVLHQALSAETVTRRRRPSLWLAPLAVGLGAAAVVLGVVVMVSQDDTAESPPAAGNDRTAVPHVKPHVGPHEVIVVNIKTLEIPERDQVREACQQEAPVERAGLLLSSQLLRGPSGPFTQFAYANRASGGQEGQFFCTPYGVTEDGYDNHLTSRQRPVRPIEDSRVRGFVPGNAGSGTQAYFDGTWFAVGHGIAAIEVRVVIDSDPGVWHETKRWSTSYLFASTWRTLTPEQAATGGIWVEYRAITTDGQARTIPTKSPANVYAGDVESLPVTIPALLENS